MKRRSFIQGLIAALFAPKVLVGKSQDKSPTPGIILPEKSPPANEHNSTTAGYNSATEMSELVCHKGIVFFADEEIIRWCPVDKLRWGSWGRASIGKEDYDRFCFWQKHEGKLYWCGKYTRWEVRTHPLMGVEFQFTSWTISNSKEK